MSNIYLTIVKRSLWIRTGTTSRYILPDSLNRTLIIRNQQFQTKSKNRTVQLQGPNNFIVVEFRIFFQKKLKHGNIFINHNSDMTQNSLPQDTENKKKETALKTNLTLLAWFIDLSLS